MKKLLALVLALVMTMSLVTISNAAFKDAESIDYKEAVEVMNAAGVLIGDEKGNFNAKAELTRAQAAKIVAYLDLGSKTAEAIVGAGNVFTDVSASHWAAGFIEYCAGAGYVAGMGDKTFAPDAKVTGVQFAKMLLCALGYKASIEGYLGSDYAIAISRDANANGLYKELSVAANTVLTREQAAQMAFNALKADTVEYRGGTEVSTADGTKVIVNAVRNNKEYTTDYRTPAAGVANREQLVEKLYGTSLKLTTSGSDGFGRPTHTWTYKTIKVGSYFDEPTLTYTGEVKAKQVYADLGSPNSGSFTVNSYVNGSEASTYTASGDTMWTAAALNKSNSNKGTTHKGTVTEVFYNTDMNPAVVTVVSYDYYLVKALENYNEKDNNVDVAVYHPILSSATLDGDDFAIQDVKKDDYLVVTVSCTGPNAADCSIETVASVNKVENVKVSVARANDYVTAAGTKYEYAYAATIDTNTIGKTLMNSASYSLNDKTYNLYLDPNGYVIGVEGFSAKTDISKYLWVSAVNTASAGFDDTIKVVYTDGTKETLTVSKVDDKESGDAGYAHPVVGKFYEFSKSGSSVKLTSVPTTGAKVNQYSTYAVLSDTVTPVAGYTANNDTVYLTKSTVYNGVKNAPKTTEATSIYALVDDTNTVIFLYSTKTGASTTDVNAYVYILNNTPAKAKDSKDKDYYIYDAIVNGEKTTLEANDNGKAAGLYKIDTYTDGRADLGSAVTYVAGEVGYVATATAVKAESGVVKGTGFAYKIADDCVIRSVNGNTVSAVNAGTVERTYEEGFDTLYMLFKSTTDSTVVAMYMVK